MDKLRWGYSSGKWELPAVDADSPPPSLSPHSSDVQACLEKMELSPLDKWNLELLNKVHPRDWVNPAGTDRYNIIVIGAGAGGLYTAAAAAGLGARVALVEKNLLGGDYLNSGCVPSKALLRSAHLVKQLRRAAQFGLAFTQPPTVDFPAIMRRMRQLRAEMSAQASAQRYTQELGVEVFIGEAAFVSKHHLRVGERLLEFAKCCIATGARAAVPPIDGLAEVGYLTNATLFNLEELPRRLAVFGTGAMGCEMAQAFALFGSEVHLFGRSSHLLPNEDPDSGALLQQSLAEDGVQIHLQIRYQYVGRSAAGDKIVAVLDERQNLIEIAVDQILIATGRRPNVEGLNLEAAGIGYDKRSGVAVSNSLQTTNSDVFAVGDVCGKYMHTHMAEHMARLVIRNAFFVNNAKLSGLVVPWCTYTQPQVAHVGLHLADAKTMNIKCDVLVQPFSGVDRALIDAECGFVKVVLREGTDDILGATIVGPTAADMLGEIVVAMTNKIGLGALASVIHPYPTLGAAIGKLADTYNKTKLSPPVKVLFRTWLAAKR